MKKLWKDVLLAALIAWVMPWLLLCVMSGGWELPSGTGETEPEATVEISASAQHRIPVLHDGTVTQMDLSDYLTGVLLGELPGSFHMEAKKAQAVVARTYTLRTAALGQKHPGCVCTDSSCCQAYRDTEEYLASGGDPDAVRQAQQAVTETGNQVLTYDGQLIEATYFSSSGGYTEDAVAVWGTDVPYLQCVPSPEGNTVGTDTEVKSFTVRELGNALGVALTGNPQGWFGQMTYTSGFGVDTMVICGKTFRGTELRSLLGLRSTVFSVTVKGNDIVFTTKGHGHRVGMSQYGAQSMALSGIGYCLILSHYYPGTVLDTVQLEGMVAQRYQSVL